MKTFRTLATAAALALATAAASAQTMLPDGVMTISQDGALAGGITPMDTPGFPVTISKSGTYKLTSNLVVPAGLDGIQIVDGVDATIDLNGFQIAGSAICSATTSCFSLTGTAGVRTTGNNAMMTVKNGRIRGFTWAGIGGFNAPNSLLFNGIATVDNVKVQNNAEGIRVVRLIATRVVAEANSGAGVWTLTGNVSESRANSNGGHGFVVMKGVVHDTMAMYNLANGYATDTTTLLHHNVASGNTDGAVKGSPVMSGNAF